MKRFVAFVCAAIMVLAIMAGCKVDGAESHKSQVNPGVTEGQAEAPNSEQTIKDIVGSHREGIFIESSDGVVEPIVSTYTEEDDFLNLHDDYKGIVDYQAEKERAQEIENNLGTSLGTIYKTSDDGYLHLSRSSGQRLLMVSSVNNDGQLRDYTLTYSGYCQPSNISGYLKKYNSVGGVDTSSYSKHPTEVERNIQSTLDIFIVNVGQKYALCSRTSRTLDADWYEGTTYKQGSLDLTQPIVITKDPNFAHVDIETTKDGYAILDISGLAAGLHSIELNKRYYVLFIDD